MGARPPCYSRRAPQEFPFHVCFRRSQSHAPPLSRADRRHELSPICLTCSSTYRSARAVAPACCSSIVACATICCGRRVDATAKKNVRVIASIFSQTDDDSAIPFTAKTKSAPLQGQDQLDLAGQAILSLLDKAARAAEASTRRAVETAQELSGQLRAAENRIAELEAENHLYRERSERAEEWLRRIYSEIQDNLVRKP